jgi:hypothetical protein
MRFWRNQLEKGKLRNSTNFLKICRREIKNFSIRKANHPNRMQASADQGEESMMNNGLAGDHISPRANGKMNGHQNGLSMKHNNENSLLTKEEQEALKPKDVKVVNPWIYEQTHQEYLENIKVSIDVSFIIVSFLIYLNLMNICR